MARLRYNGLSTTLGGSLASGATTAVTFAAALTYNGGTSVPTITGSDYIPLSILDSAGKLAEVVYLTAYTSGATTGTIARGKEGTSGAARASGLKVVQAPTTYDAPGVSSALIFGLQSPISNVNWSTVGITSTYRGLQGVRDSTAAQNAEIIYPVTLEAGTYTFDLFHLASTNRGIYDVQFDGTSVGTIDGYAAATAAAMGSITGITVAKSGRINVRLLMSTKNASSTAYQGSLHGFGLTRTGD